MLLVLLQTNLLVKGEVSTDCNELSALLFQHSRCMLLQRLVVALQSPLRKVVRGVGHPSAWFWGPRAFRLIARVDSLHSKQTNKTFSSGTVEFKDWAENWSSSLLSVLIYTPIAIIWLFILLKMLIFFHSRICKSCVSIFIFT